MCNAMNHRAGCDCGFGPPEGSAGDPIPQPRGRSFQGRVKRGERSSWGEQAISNENVLRMGLQEVGADPRTIRKAILDYHKEGLPLGKNVVKRMDADKKRDLINALKRLVGIRKYKIEERKTKTIRVPLFTFGAPSIPRSKVSYEESTDFQSEKGWTVSLVVPGMGMGASQEFETKYSIKYSCDAGVFKTIFAPIRIRICKLGVYEKGVRVKDGGMRVTAEGGKVERNFQRGITLCKQPECTRKSATYERTFYDSGDLTRDIATATQERSCRKPIETRVGLNVFGVQAGVTAKVKLQKKITLQYKLPGGHDYHLYRLKLRHGIAWKTS